MLEGQKEPEAAKQDEPSADLLREDLKSEYSKDFEAKQRLDAKASSMVTMAGVIAAVFTGFGTFVLRDISSPNPILFAVTIFAMLIELLFLIAAIYHAYKTTRVAGYTHVLIWSTFIANDEYDNDKIRLWKRSSREEYNNRMIKDYLAASKTNSELNDSKGKRLAIAERAFLGAIITIPIFAVLVIATKLAS